jgi:hypothetical protein
LYDIYMMIVVDCCCWACHTRVSAEMCQSKEVSHTRDENEEVEKKEKEIWEKRWEDL